MGKQTIKLGVFVEKRKNCKSGSTGENPNMI